MPFDLSSAAPVDAPSKGGFDLSSAKPAGEASKPSPAPAAPAAGGPEYKDLLGVPEAALNVGSGMIAGPVGNVAGLASIPLHAAGMIDTPPQQVQQNVQRGMTYEPRSQAGRSLAHIAGIPGELWGKLAHGISGIVAPPETSGPARAALGYGVEGAIEQAPMLAGAKAPVAAEATSAALKGTARDMMQSALKPGIEAQRTGKADRAIDTMLDKGINVSRGGVDRLKTRIGGLNDLIAERIKDSGVKVDKTKVAERLQGALKKFQEQVTPQSDLKTIQRAWEDFMDHPDLPKVTPGKVIPEKESAILDERGRPFTTPAQVIPPSGTNLFPVQKAQSLKQGTYRALGDKSYGELKGADIEAQKTLARGLKEEIADAVPDVRRLNAEESDLLNALSITERRVMMEANKNPIGLGWLSLNPKHLAGWMADRSGLFKSLIARMLNTGSKGVPAMDVAGPIAGTAISNPPPGPPPQ